jgi:hypothetical protein
VNASGEPVNCGHCLVYVLAENEFSRALTIEWNFGRHRSLYAWSPGGISIPWAKTIVSSAIAFLRDPGSR